MCPLKLPIGVQSFSEMRTGGYAYVDKTWFISDLVIKGKYYFLSRPRRFGKSLFIDTLDCAFSGRKDLFFGLYLDSPEAEWDFNTTYPVLRVDFAGGTLKDISDLFNRLTGTLDEWEELYGIDKSSGDPGDRLLSLIPKIAKKTKKQVVILIDEYDRPILDNIGDISLVQEMRDCLKNFYGAIKPLDLYLKFVLLTGVSKFAKTGIFSGLNNLQDITLISRYSAICGYTHEDLKTVFFGYLADLDLDEVKKWYDGYSWTGETVYNPFDILLFFGERTFRPYWFETGTPSFLIALWQKNPRLPAEYDGLVAGNELLGSFDPEYIRVETLLFQAGYLTIKSWSADPIRGFRCVLGYPNTEVRTSLNFLFSEALSGHDISGIRDRLYNALEQRDIEQLQSCFHSFFASIPYDWYRNNPIAGYEGYYASVVYTYFASLGYDVIPEDTTNKGRVDLTVKTRTGIFIFEFKVLGLDKSGDESPLDQIKKRGYAEKYQSDTRQVYEIGIVFDPETRNIQRWEI
ncbi:MAG: ATP-binding protein [Methanospirillaceae archaeon]|nr:ATP-binding protein [Methanospirillaceae archaeon]